jgi:hypothetical protein
MFPDPAPPFEVGMSDDLREQILAYVERAIARGFGGQFREGVAAIMSALRESPRGAGDPLRHLRGITSTLYRIVREGLIVHYTVHDRIPMVTVWRFEPGPGHLLAPPPPNGN